MRGRLPQMALGLSGLQVCVSPVFFSAIINRASAGGVERREKMARTKSFKDLVQRHVKADKNFAEALLREGVDAMLGGDVDMGKTILRDYIRPQSVSKSSARRRVRRQRV